MSSQPPNSEPGPNDPKLRVCFECGGAGRVLERLILDPASAIMQTCRNCGGTGRDVADEVTNPGDR